MDKETFEIDLTRPIEQFQTVIPLLPTLKNKEAALVEYKELTEKLEADRNLDDETSEQLVRDTDCCQNWKQHKHQFTADPQKDELCLCGQPWDVEIHN